MPDYGDERGFGGGSATGRSLADVLRDNVPSGMERSNRDYRVADPRDFFNQWRNPDTTTVPAGFNDPDRFGRMRPTGATNPYAAPIDNNPMRGANIGGGWNMYEGAPDRTPRFMPMSGGMDSGAYLSSRYGGGIDDAAGMNDDARGMIEGAGFEVANLGTDKRTERKLWKLAVNKLPVGTPQPQLIEEWEKLKAEFYRRKYGE
jgi:hypothetical protein